ncbi:MAG: hypothetical protein OEN01_07780 [Candidatus Krumholzibacteria bacterium]|nr:hypothetical protein [Candidatus Krumholzibacteria bacterium]
MIRPLFAFTRFSTILVIAAMVSCSESRSPFTPKGGSPNDTLPPIEPSDTIAPAAVTDASLDFSSTGTEIVFRWSAPHDDAPTDKVDRYEIRFSYTRGSYPPAFWDLSTPVSDPPDPGEPGTVQSYIFDNLERGKDLYVGIRSYDDSDNRSQPSDLATAHIPGLDFLGRCVDVYTRVPIEGLGVRIASGPVFDVTTDVNGEFSVDEVFPGAVSFDIVSGPSTIDYHRLSQLLVLDSDSTHVFVMIRVEPTTAPELNGANLLSFLKQITETDDRPVLAKWRHYPVRCYIVPFVNSNGVDYELASKTAAQRWNARTGRPIFTLVDSAPDTGIVVIYRPREEMSGIAFTHYELDEEGHPVREEIHVVDDFRSSDASYLYSVMLHELGHTIGFAHINLPNFIMYGQHLVVDDISDDETAAAILLQALPTRVDMSTYDESTP